LKHETLQIKIVNVHFTLALGLVAEPKAQPQPLGDVKCDICELVIRAIDDMVGGNASETKINATIYEVCNDLPGSAKKFVSFVSHVKSFQP